MRANFSFIFLILVGLQSYADLISLPENCFEKKITPCLVHATTPQNLVQKEQASSFELSLGTIVKFKVLSEGLALEILQGQVNFHSSSFRDLTLNGARFETKQLLAIVKLKEVWIFDTKNYKLSRYAKALNEDEPMRLTQSEFATKKDLVQLSASFYPQKVRLLSFLHSIEAGWASELKAQTKLQTKVLARSIAAIEKSDKQKQEERLAEKEKIKNARDLFFYRTFYR